MLHLKIQFHLNLNQNEYYIKSKDHTKVHKTLQVLKRYLINSSIDAESSCLTCIKIKYFNIICCITKSSYTYQINQSEHYIESKNHVKSSLKSPCFIPISHKYFNRCQIQLSYLLENKLNILTFILHLKIQLLLNFNESEYDIKSKDHIKLQLKISMFYNDIPQIHQLIRNLVVFLVKY